MASKSRRSPTRDRRVTFQTGPWKGVKDLLCLSFGLAHSLASSLIPSLVSRSHSLFVAIKPLLFSSPSTDSTIPFSFLQKVRGAIVWGKGMTVKAMRLPAMDGSHIIAMSMPDKGVSTWGCCYQVLRITTSPILAFMMNVVSLWDRSNKELIDNPMDSLHSFDVYRGIAELSWGWWCIPASRLRIFRDFSEYPLSIMFGYHHMDMISEWDGRVKCRA